METYDAIVIGSGMGGLTTASLLAQVQGKRVLVLERHFTFGGFTHVFSRKGFTWDVGIHYVGNMGAGRSSRQMMDLVTGHGVDWQPLPDRFDRFIYPEMTFEVPSDVNQYMAELTERFPAERAGIARYFRDIRRIARWLGMEVWSWGAPGYIRVPLRLATINMRTLGALTTQAYLDQTFHDARLKALLTSQWGDYGLTPSASAFGYHAMVVASYFHGAWYPVGGGEALAAAIVPIITRAGGACLVDHTVTEILVEDGRAVGVRAEQHQGKKVIPHEFRAPLVISDAGAAITYGSLLPAHHRGTLAARAQAEEAPWSMVSLYLGLRESPATLGSNGANLWIFPGYDHDALVDTVEKSTLYVSFPSLKDPRATAHTMEVLMPVRYADFAKWRATTWKRRGAEYEAYKAELAEGMISRVEAILPGLRNLIVYQEVATPLTVEEFTGNAGGAIYGMPVSPHRLRAHIGAANTPVKGLLLTGADACMLGIEGAMMGGVFAAAATMGPQGLTRLTRMAADAAVQPARPIDKNPVDTTIPVGVTNS